MSFSKKLIESLKTEERFTDENGELIKKVVINHAWKTDPGLVEILLSDEGLKKEFFDEIKNHWVFNINKFIAYISDKNFLDNSYTRFSSKIGLNIDDKFLRQRGEVSLAWPYKDCVLEGGQTKEEESRKEIFFNEVLAREEINRMFDPKVLTNWKRYTPDGKEEVGEIKRDKEGTIRENLIIKGNNLIALHTLKEQFKNKISLIYLDPPYNTGNDSFGYNDGFNHSSWLTFMKNRLEVAKELLHKSGAIFIQVDDAEMAYLKVLCDEVFGRENFKECISIKTGSESGVNAINVLRGEQLFKVKEYILYYAKNHTFHRFNPMYVKAMYYNYSYRYEVIKEKDSYVVIDVYKKIINDLYKKDSLRALSSEQKQAFFVAFEEYCLKNYENIYALKTDIQKSGDKFKDFAKKNKEKNIVEEYKTSDGRTTLVYKGGMLTPLAERVVSEGNKKRYGVLVSDYWWDISATPSAEGGVKLKSGKKPEKLIKRIFDLATEEGDIVLDFFLGSGTTAAVAHKMKRQYIGVEQLNYNDNDSITRLKKIIGCNTSCDQTGISKTVNWKGGGNFIYLELMKYNQAFIDKIQNANNSDELIKTWKSICKNSFLNWYINPEMPQEAVNDFKKIGETENGLQKQKKLLLELLNKNQLYVNLSEIEDEQFNVSDEDKKMNYIFYQRGSVNHL